MRCGELVFNTAMTGYEEICTDPSYCEQIVLFSYPHIGNTGINYQDGQSNRPQLSGVVTREVPTPPSNYRSKISFGDYLKENDIPAIANIDTRNLVKAIRDHGARDVCIDCRQNGDQQSALKFLSEFKYLCNRNLVSVVAKNKSMSKSMTESMTGTNTDNGKIKIAVVDLGVKQAIIDQLQSRNCHVTVYPMDVDFDLLKESQGVVISNGPGDPAVCTAIFPLIKKLIDKQIPLLGICLGFQVIALSLGAKTSKMKFGHHGSNHPVVDLRTNKVGISSQNHGFEVIESSLPQYIESTHKSLFDSSLQGYQSSSIIGFQGHPEANPGPHEFSSIFDDFVAMVADTIDRCEDAKK